jgi:hypothetical protein
LLRDGAGRSVSAKLGATALIRQGLIAVDMRALIASTKQDLRLISGEAPEMCRKCNTSMWAVFCRQR